MTNVKKFINKMEYIRTIGRSYVNNCGVKIYLKKDGGAVLASVKAYTDKIIDYTNFKNLEECEKFIEDFSEKKGDIAGAQLVFALLTRFEKSEKLL